MARCPARYRWGLTATPERSDGLGFSLPFLFGEIYEAASAQELIEGGYLQRPTVVGVETGWSTPEHLFSASGSCDCGRGFQVSRAEMEIGRRCYGCGERIEERHVDPEGFRLLEYAKALSLLCEDEQRTQIAVQIAGAAADAERRVLVLTARIALAEEIAETLLARGFDARALSSRTRKLARREAVEGLRSGALSILVATTLADEGLDVPDLDCVVLAAPSRSSGKTKQRAGRAVRPSGRDPLIFDLVDGDVFTNQWRARKAAYLREYGSECLLSDSLLSSEEAVKIAGRAEYVRCLGEPLG